MENFTHWLLYYAVPAGIATSYLKSKQPSLRNRVLIMHGFLLLSIVLLSSLKIGLIWDFQILSVVSACIALYLVIYLLKFNGLLYAISSLIQEYSLLLAGLVIIPVIGVWLGALITALPYTLAHFPNRQDWKSWQRKFPILFLWGTVSVLLYFWLHQPLLNIALHAVGGAILIHKGFLYQGWQKGYQPVLTVID